MHHGRAALGFLAIGACPPGGRLLREPRVLRPIAIGEGDEGVRPADGLVSDVMPICMIIALDIVMTLRGSINCSTVICSPTVIFAILREASSEHYGPGSISHHIFSLTVLLRCTFRLHISLCNQS